MSFKPVFLKQYGERRTGTNYLRGLLRANFENAVVLMHVLGDKHSAPVPIDLPQSGSSEDAHAWVRRLTHAAPAESTRSGNEAQEQYMRDVAVDLLEAARDQRLGFLVSVKDPYAWGASVSAYYGWLPRGGPRAKPHLPLPAPVRRMLRPVERAVKCRQLWAGCLRSNRKHRAWLDLYERFPSQVTIVRYEDLLTESGKILCDIQRKYGLRQRGEQVSAIDQVLFPAWWDHSTRVLEERPFDASHYAERRYFEVLPPPMVDVITKAIDWPLMANFGYKRI